MEIRKQSGRVTKERELQLQDYLVHTVLFTAGAAVLMACLKRSWVFLVLNLILLAILFTSFASTPNENQECNNNNNNNNNSNNNNNNNDNDEKDSAEVVKIEREKKIRQSRWPAAQVEELREYEEVYKKSTSEGNEQDQECFEDSTEEVPKLSKEALNERVEAFIVMFRQHLISDARN